MALPPPSQQSGNHVAGEFNGVNVGNVYYYPSIHREVHFPQVETPFKANMVCPQGTAGVDNTCLCPNSASSPPYREQPMMYQAAYTALLFTPTQDAYNPMPNAEDKALSKQRAPTSWPHMQ